MLGGSDQTVWYDLLPHLGTLAFQIWTEMYLVFSFQVGLRSGFIFVVLYVPEIPPKVTGLVTLSRGGARVTMSLYMTLFFLDGVPNRI